jgi:hypothetical protein
VWEGYVTDVGHVNLTATTACPHTTTISAAGAAGAKSAASGCTVVAAAASCRWAGESRFGLTILISHIRADRMISQGGPSYLSNIDESSHEVLIAESVDCLLSLLPRSIFYDAGNMLEPICIWREFATYPHPYITRGTTSQSVNPTFLQ